MGKKLVVLLLTLAVLAVLSGGYVVGGLQAYALYQKEHTAHAEFCGGQAPVNICVQAPKVVFSAFYPSYLAAQTALFTVTYSSSTPLTLVVKSSVANFTQTLLAICQRHVHATIHRVHTAPAWSSIAQSNQRAEYLVTGAGHGYAGSSLLSQ